MIVPRRLRFPLKRSQTPLLHVAALLAACTFSVPAATVTWTGGGTDSLWDDAGNWSPSLTWGSTLNFAGSIRLANTNNIEGWRFAGLSFSEGAGAFVLGGNAIELNGSLSSRSLQVQTLAFDGIALVTDQTAEIGTGAQVLVQSPLSGSYGLRKAGGGTLTLSGLASYTGATTVSEGALVLDLANHSNGLLGPASALTLENGSLVIKGAGAGLSAQQVGSVGLSYRTTSRVVIDSNGGAGTALTMGSLSDDTNGQLYVDLSAGASLQVTNASATVNGLYSHVVVTEGGTTGFGTLNGSNQIVRYTGASTLPSTGSLATGNYSVSGNAAVASERHELYTLAIDASADGSLDLGGGGSLAFSPRGAILVTGTGNFTLTGGTSFGVENNGQEFIIHHAGTGVLTSQVGLQLRYSNIFTKDGEGVVALAAAGTSMHGGLITVNEGSIRLDHETALGTGALVFNYADNGLTFGEGISRFQIGALGGSKNLRLENINGEGITLALGGAAGTGTFYGSFEGTGILESVAYSDRTNTLAGANSHTGGTIVNSGTLRVIGEGTLGAANVPLTVNDGVLDLYGTTQTVGSFRGAGGLVTTSQSGGGLRAGSNQADEFSGVMSGSMQLWKKGSGSLKFTAAANADHTGATTIEEGRLIVNGMMISSEITVVSGASLSGSGQVGVVHLQGGSTIAAGAQEGQAVGLLSASSVEFTGGLVETTIELALNSDGTGTAGVNWSALAAAGPIVFGDGITTDAPIRLSLFTLDLANDPAALTDWNPLIDHVWAGFLSSDIGIAAIDLDLFLVDASHFQNTINGTFSVQFGDGGKSLNLVYTAVPEPASLILGLAGLLVCGLAGRKIRRDQNSAGQG